jgi:hypothetical protein
MSWQTERSGHVVIDGTAVRHSETSPGQGHAVWSKGGSGYWLFQVGGCIERGGFWLGVISPDNFGPGHRLRGLFYSSLGSLSDGNSVVAARWGRPLAHGDTVGMRLEQTRDRVTLAFSHNGTALGVAFDIRGWNGRPLQPAVSLQEAGQSVRITPAERLPPLESMLVGGAPEAGSLEGVWRAGGCTVQVQRQGFVTFEVVVKVANTRHYIVNYIKEGTFHVKPFKSTKEGLMHLLLTLQKILV